jgi:glycosyltransferase involved in cell wall biosynthesis
METLFAGADAFVFPYREIEASGVLYRVLGYGRWLIASRLGAFAEVIEDGAAGRLVTPDDPDCLAAALAEAATSRPLPTARARVSDWATIARATCGVYAAARDEWLGNPQALRQVATQ